MHTEHQQRQSFSLTYLHDQSEVCPALPSQKKKTVLYWRYSKAVCNDLQVPIWLESRSTDNILLMGDIFTMKIQTDSFCQSMHCSTPVAYRQTISSWKVQHLLPRVQYLLCGAYVCIYEILHSPVGLQHKKQWIVSYSAYLSSTFIMSRYAILWIIKTSSHFM